MKTKDALRDLFARMSNRDDFSIDRWIEDDWVRAPIGDRLIPIFPKWGYKDTLLLHDTHHVVTGYDTSFAGEVLLACWELGSGGCGRNLFFWVDRLSLLLIGLIVMPGRAVGALRAGSGCRNLYGRNPQEVLAQDLEEVRGYVSGEPL